MASVNFPDIVCVLVDSIPEPGDFTEIPSCLIEVLILSAILQDFHPFERTYPVNTLYY